MGFTGMGSGRIAVAYRAMIRPVKSPKDTVSLTVYLYPFTNDPKRNCRAVVGGLEFLQKDTTLFMTTQDATKY